MPPTGRGGWAARPISPQMAPVLQIEEARERLERMLGRIPDWSGLEPPFAASNGRAGGAGAPRWLRTLLACLELARDGKVEISQRAPFDEIYVRDRLAATSPLAPETGA